MVAESCLVDMVEIHFLNHWKIPKEGDTPL